MVSKISVILRSLVAALVIACFLSCENPFKSGLGKKVDIVPPTLSVTAPDLPVEYYIHGITVFKGQAGDDRGISSVQVKAGGAPFVDVDSYDPVTNEWIYKFNTLYDTAGSGQIRPDGDMILIFRAVDIDGKNYDTNEIKHYIKNSPPKLELEYPVRRWLYDPDRFNKPIYENTSSYENLGVLPTGGEIRGIVSDKDGIDPWYPKIQFWAAGDTPPDFEDESQWYGTEISPSQVGEKLIAKEFRYTLVPRKYHKYDANNNHLGFVNPDIDPDALIPASELGDYLPINVQYKYRLKVKDSFGIVQYYPPGASDGYELNSDESDYVYISAPAASDVISLDLRAAEEKPVVEITNPLRTTGTNGVPTGIRPSADYPDNIYHPYVTAGNVSFKHDDFVFQVQATHSEGVVKFAVLSYEYRTFNDPNSLNPVAQGVLEWDAPDLESGWAGNTVIMEDGNPAKVFTFSTSKNVFDKYLGENWSSYNSNPGADPDLVDALYGNAKGSGSHPPDLKRGIYKFKVRTYSVSSSWRLREFTINVDNQEPKIDIKIIEGADFDESTDTYLVNGFVKVRLLAFDEQTRLRTYLPDEANPLAWVEQKWVLSNSGDSNLVKSHVFPVNRATGAGTAYENTVFTVNTAADNLPVVMVNPDTSVFAGTASLDDGNSYYLYMVARDAAYNVGISSVEILVDQAWDKPRIESPDADFRLEAVGSSTWTADQLMPGVTVDGVTDPYKRNRLNGTDIIPLFLADDDSLHLEKTRVWITREGMDDNVVPDPAQPEAVYNEKWWKLPQETIKLVFGENLDYHSETNPNNVRKERDATLTLAHLATALNKNNDRLPYWNSQRPSAVPEGKYKIRIQAQDYLDVKKAISTVSENPDESGAEGLEEAFNHKEFWISVDTRGPNLYGILPGQNSQAKGEVILRGVVRDAGEVETFRVLPPYKPGPNGLPATAADWVDIMTTPAVPEDWSWEPRPWKAGDQYYEYDWTYKGNVDHGNLTTSDSERTFSIHAVDKFGNAENASRTLMIDNERPVVSMLIGMPTVPDASTGLNVNGTVRFTVGIEEDYPALPPLKYYFRPTASTAITVPALGPDFDPQVENNYPVANPPLTVLDLDDVNLASQISDKIWEDATEIVKDAANTYTVTINTRDDALYTDGQWYRLYVIGKDLADNYSVSKDPGKPTETARARLELMNLQTVKINQATDKPVFSNVRPNRDYVGQDATMFVSGTVKDDDGFTDPADPDNVPLNAIEIRFLDINRNPIGDWRNLGYHAENSVTVRESGKTLDFRFKIPKPVPDVEGEYFFELRASDHTKRKYNDPPVTAVTDPPYSYNYDMTPPKIVFDDSDFNKSFRAYPSKYFYIGIIEKKLNPVASSSGSVPGLQFNFANTGLSNSGLYYDYDDEDPGEDYISKTLKRVSLDPSDTDADALYEAGDRTAIIETIEGQTKTYSIDSASADYNPDLKIFKIPSKSLEQKRRWDELSGNTAPLLTEGTHTILFQALDQAGLRNSRDFSFKKDITGPDIRFEGIRKSFTADGASVVKHAASGDLAVKGLFSDAQTPIWITGEVEPEFTYRLYNVNLSDLTDEKALTAFDVPRQLVLSGQTNELTAPWSVSLKTATPMAGYTGGYIADGLHKLKLEIKDRIGNAGNLVSSSGDSPEGVYFYTDSKKPETISVKAVDPSAPATEYTSKVFAASGSPVFRIMGSSEDANLSAVTIRIGSAVAPEVNITSSGTFVDTESSGVFMRTLDWSYDVPNLPNSAYDLLADNQEHKIYIYAKDLAGNSTVTEWVFFKDSNSPVIDFTSMNAGTTLLSTSRPEIKGSATDDNRIKELSSVIQKWDYAAANSSEGIASEQPGAWNGELEGAATLLPSGYPAEGRASQSWSKSFTTLASGDPGYDGGIDGARLYIPDGMYRIKVTAKDNSAGAAAGNPVDTGWKIFFVDKTAPVFTLKENNPYIGTAGGNIKLSGTVQDNNRIRRVRIKLNSQDFDTGTVTSWTPPTETDKKSSGVINWEVPAFPVSGSSFTVYLEAEDWAGNKTALQQAYIADNNPPTLNPIYPAPVEGNAQPARLRGRELIQGTADDDRGLELLKIAVGSVDIAAAEADWKNWDSDSANPHYDGTTVPIIREGTNYSWSLKIANVNNLVTGATTAAANNWVSWVNPASTSSYAPPLTGSLRDSNIWALPVKIWMKDLAGNTDTKDFTYWIDPYGDLPSVEINSPKNNGIVGGAVTVNGSATDNARVENVAYRVRTGPGYDTSVALEDFGAVLHAPSNALGTVTPDPGTSSPPANSPNNWYTAAIAGGNRAAKVQWNFKINTTGQFNPGAASTNRIYIDVMGWDSVQNASGEYLPANTDKQAGWFKTIEVDVEKGVPEFLSYFILQGTYASHTAVGESRLLVDPLNGDFYIETEVTDESRLDSISYRKPGGDMENILSAANKSIQWDTGNTAANWDSSYAHPLTISGGAIMPETDGLYHYKLHIKTNLDSLQPAPDKAGTFLLAIHATDESEPAHYTGELNLTVQVDNFFPLSSYTGSSYVVGTNYSLQGKAWDEISAEPFGVSVGDIKKVEAWFKSGSNYYDTLHAASTSTMQLSGIKAGRYVNGSVIETPASYPGVSGGTVNRPVNYLTIDRNEVTDDDGDGIIEGWVENGADKEWSAIIDTSVLPAGPITLCYLVYDIAGNATYYENSLVVRNGGPSILGVSLGTNLYKDLSFTTGSLQNLPNQEKVVTTNFSEITGFAVRNQGLHVRAMVSKNTGRTNYQYTLSYISGPSGAAINASALVKGSWYQIVSMGDTAWESVGAPPGAAAGTVFMAVGKTQRGSGTAQLLTLTLSQTMNAASEYNHSYLVPGAAAEMSPPTNTVNFVYDSVVFAENGGDTPNFVLRVVDKVTDDTPAADSIDDYVVLYIPIANTDPARPGDVRLYDLNPVHETGNGAAAAQPAAINRSSPGAWLASRNQNRGGLYNTGSAANLKKSGHIEPRSANTLAPSATSLARDTLSGEVILRGYACDDQRIDKIALRLNGTDYTILEWNPAQRKLAPDATNGKKGGSDIAFTSEVMDLSGHYVEWAYIWDTQKYPAGIVVYNNMSVQAVLTDSVGSSTTSSIGFDLAPYITGFTRKPQASASNITAGRTKFGWYSASRGDQLNVTGFNLSKDSGADLTIGGTAAIATGAQTAAIVSFTIAAGTGSGAAVLTAQSSNSPAADVIAVNSNPLVTSHNNSWNREDLAGQDWTTSWNDTRSLRIWESEDTIGSGTVAGGKFGGPNDGDGAGNPSSRKASYTGMSIQSNGTLHGSWGKVAWDSSFAGTNMGTSSLIRQWMDAQAETDIHYGSRPTVVYNDISAYGDSPNTAGTTNGMKVWDSNANTNLNGNNAYYVEPVYRGSGDHELSRFQSPRVVSDGDCIHVAYHDNIAKSLKYWFHKSGVNGLSPANVSDNMYQEIDGEGVPAKRWISLDGGYEAYDWQPAYVPAAINNLEYATERYNVRAGITAGGGVPGTAGNRNIQTRKSIGDWVDKGDVFMTIGPDPSTIYYSPKARRSGFVYAIEPGTRPGNDTAIGLVKIQTFRILNVNPPSDKTANTSTITKKPGRVDDAGLYNAIDVNTDGYPVIAYYDGSNRRLKIAYAKVRNAVDIADWAVQDVAEAGDYSGEYVTMRIDSTDRIHIAFLRSSTDELIYLSGTRDDDNGYKDFTAVTVDKSGAVGRWADLSLDVNGNPWIAYQDNSKAQSGAYDGVKIAYLPNADQGDSAGLWKTSSNWETMHVPARFRTSNSRVHIEAAPGGAAAPNSAWSAAVGYESNDFFRIAYLVK